MPRKTSASGAVRLNGAHGLSLTIDDTGCVRRIDCGDTLINLFVANPVENGPTNLYLRLHTGDTVEVTPLLGSASPTRGSCTATDRWVGSGMWSGMRYTLSLTMAKGEPAWFWHVHVANRGTSPLTVDLVYAQDIGLAPYAMARLNEYYISQYVDHSPLQHDARGWVIASRQNLSSGRNPWSLIGSLRRAVGFATDALQVANALSKDLPSQRLQHEHSMAIVQDERMEIAAGGSATFGFFALFRDDHPAATSADDLQVVETVQCLPEASQILSSEPSVVRRLKSTSTLFSATPRLRALPLDAATLRTQFPGRWRHKEMANDGALLSFFHGNGRHVVLREKESQVLRPHGHLLRTGRSAIPDESALTSTVWMAGVFHSMLTQGHVSFNRLLSTVHSYVGMFSSHGQRVFVDTGTGWQLLDLPSAFEMTPTGCRWLYQHRQGLIEVRSEACSEPHEMRLEIEVHSGPPVRCLFSQHLALNGDDGNEDLPVRWLNESGVVTLRPAQPSALHQRFPDGSFRLLVDSPLATVGGDELLFSDGKSRQQPFLCIVSERAEKHGLRIQGHLVEPASAPDPDNTIDELSALPIVEAPDTSPLAGELERLVEIMPWFTHNALIHYLSPRGLEQYSGGGWGTRDVTQGPVEMLFALGKTLPVRDLLLRVMAAQKSDGDWPQWFMFFDRDRDVRAGDSHGDIVFWPLLALAQYLLASGDAEVLDERVPYFEGGERVTIWEHVEKALAVIRTRIIPGTALAAYGHGDWNDSLQPADPAMRETMCSSWTVTLHYQTLTTLAHALRSTARSADAQPLEVEAAAVRRDFQRLLLVDEVLAGYAMFDGESPRYLLHPRDEITGVRYSSLAMIHAILEGLFTPSQAKFHLQLIRAHLTGPDGVRLFDRPMRYHGGPQQFFQRAESATFFGREIGLMYMHAHLRYTQALAHVGDAEGFFHALCQSNPIGLASIVPTARLRQVNCYYSSSDAAFADRYEASAEYDRVAAGTIALEGGWRVYSSGAGIALGLIVRRFLGLNCESGSVSIDPVIPHALSGLKVRTRLCGHEVEVTYQVGPAGCGVSSVLVNGGSLSITRDANPYRQGAARIAMTDLAARLRAGLNAVVVQLD